MWQEFKEFLLTQNALALAVAVVIGAALTKVVNSIVDDLIMPIIGALLPAGDWQTAVWKIGSVELGVGNFLAAVINFIIIGFVIWRITKLIPAKKEDAK